MKWLLSLVLVLLAVGTLRVVGCGDDDHFCVGEPVGTPCTFENGDDGLCLEVPDGEGGVRYACCILSGETGNPNIWVQVQLKDCDEPLEAALGWALAASPA